jgi:phenylacetate-CoA ligase
MSGAYTALCSGLLFPLHEFAKGHRSVQLRRSLERSQWWSPPGLHAYRVERLRKFLISCASRVPYYRDQFARVGFDPNAVRGLDALRSLPLLEKSNIRSNTELLKADGHGHLTRYSTGGSSGEPLIFFMGKGRINHDVAAKWRATRWWGVDIGDPELVVWGSPIEVGAQDRVRRLRDAVLRSRLLPAFDMSEASLDQFVNAIRRARPAMLFGYPSSLALIAKHAIRRKQPMEGLGIRVAFVTSERLYDSQRATISQVFGCPVANGYGARDAGFIAHECASGGMHISAEDIIVETIRPDGTPTAPSEAGEIVVTHMATDEFPLVRYRTGDIGLLSSDTCRCGRGLPLLAQIQGRTTDFVVAQDGTVMHGLALIYTVRDLPGVVQFKIEQLSLDQTVVQIVGGAAFDVAAERKIIRDFKARLGENVAVRIERVHEIRQEASGKFRYVVSRVRPPGIDQGIGDA